MRAQLGEYIAALEIKFDLNLTFLRIMTLIAALIFLSHKYHAVTALEKGRRKRILTALDTAATSGHAAVAWRQHTPVARGHAPAACAPRRSGAPPASHPPSEARRRC